MTAMGISLVFMLALFGVTAGVAYWAAEKFHDFSLIIYSAAAVLCLAVLAGWVYSTIQGLSLGLALDLTSARGL